MFPKTVFAIFSENAASFSKKKKKRKKLTNKNVGRLICDNKKGYIRF